MDRKFGEHVPVPMFRVVERVARGLHRLYLVSQKKTIVDFWSTALLCRCLELAPFFFLLTCDGTACDRRASAIRERSTSAGSWVTMTGSTRTRSTSSACYTSRGARGCRCFSLGGTSFRGGITLRTGWRQRQRQRQRWRRARRRIRLGREVGGRPS